MQRIPVRREDGGCLTFLSTCAKAVVVALPAALVAFIVGGDELRGVGGRLHHFAGSLPRRDGLLHLAAEIGFKKPPD